MTDFEKGAINAFGFEFPGATCKGCYFHFNQCLYRKLCDLGLKVQYVNDKVINEWFRMTMILPLVPLDLIRAAHSIILTRIPNDSQAIDDYCTYLLENWIGDSSENINEKFERELWNHHDSKT
jgi:hypothetical protein